MIVRLYYADGETEERALVDGVQSRDYSRRADVPESGFAFNLRGREIRYLKIEPNRDEPIERMEIENGRDWTAPMVMAVTVLMPCGTLHVPLLAMSSLPAELDCGDNRSYAADLPRVASAPCYQR